MMYFKQKDSKEHGVWHYDLFVFDDFNSDADRAPTVEDWQKFFSGLHFNKCFIDGLNPTPISYREFRKLYRRECLHMLFSRMSEVEFADWFVFPETHRNYDNGELLYSNPFVYELPYDFLDDEKEERVDVVDMKTGMSTWRAEV